MTRKQQLLGAALPAEPILKQADAEAICATLPAAADSAAVAAVLRAIAELVAQVHVREHMREAYSSKPYSRMTVTELRDRWEEADACARAFIGAVVRIRPPQSNPPEKTADWSVKLIRDLAEFERRAAASLEGLQMIIDARKKGIDTLHETITSAVLRIYTDVGGGELKFNRGKRGGEPYGSCIDYLSACLAVITGEEPPKPEALAYIINCERKRRRHTQEQVLQT